MNLASLYVRLSKEAGDTNLSKDGMVKDLRLLAASLGYGVYAIHIDDGLSGAIRDRPEFTAWLNDAREGKVIALLAWHGDRLTREGVNAAAMVLDVLEGKDPVTGRIVRPPVRLVSYDDRLDSNDEDGFRWRFLIAAENARAERNRMKSRITAAQRRLRDEKRYRGGTCPYGYQVVPHPSGRGRGLAVKPDEAAFLALAAEHLLKGNSLYSTVELLNRKGSKPHRAEAWSMPSLRAVLVGDAVLGRMSHKGVVLRDDDGLPIAPWDPALDLDTVEQLRALLLDPKRNSGAQKRVRAARLLSGMLVCSTCGGRLRVNNSKNGKYEYVRYICVGVAQGRGCARPVTVNAGNLDQHIEDAFLRAFGAAKVREKVRRLRERADLAEIEHSLKDLSAQLVEDGADIPTITAQITNLHARRAELQKKPAESEVEYIDTGKTVEQMWNEADAMHMRRELVAWALDGRQITVRPGTPRKKGLELDRLDIPWRTDITAWADLKEAAAQRGDITAEVAA